MAEAQSVDNQSSSIRTTSVRPHSYLHAIAFAPHGQGNSGKRLSPYRISMAVLRSQADISLCIIHRRRRISVCWATVPLSGGSVCSNINRAASKSVYA